MLQLSIIIPTHNEAEGITKLLTHLQKIRSQNITSEIIVVDGESTDQTTTLVESRKEVITLNSSKGRAKQLNVGARKAEGEIVYFLHADTFPPKGFDEAIIKAVSLDKQAGSFRMTFNKKTFFFNFWSWFTRFKWDIASGGDQSLFITRTLFNQIGGFNEEWVVMEDIEIMSRIKLATNYIKLPQKVITSTRKYDKLGAVKLQTIFSIMHIKKIVGVAPEGLYAYYKNKISF